MNGAPPTQNEAVSQHARAERPGIKGRSRKRRGRGLNAQQAGYLLGRLEGKSKRKAALDAGYSDVSARNAAQNY